MNQEDSKGISRLELLRAGAIGIGGITLLGSLVGAGCASEKLVTADGPPKTDPKLLKYHEVSSFKTGFHWLRGICTDGKSIWVAGDMAIQEFDMDGQHLKKHEVGGTAKCVAVAPDGLLYSATDDQIISPRNGARWASLGPRARIVSIAASTNEVFVGDAGNRRVVRYNRDGKQTGTFGEKTTDYPGLIVPSPFMGLTIHSTGDLLVTNIGKHRVERHSPEGHLIEAVGESGMGMESFCGCCNPTHVSVLPNGDMVTSEKGLPRVKVISPDGSLKCVVAGPELFHAETLGLATAVCDNRVLILDPWEGAVRIFAPV